MNTITSIDTAWHTRQDLDFYVLRLDLHTRWAMGNKHFKLQDNLSHLTQQKATRVLSFGGAWSNHLLALAQSTEMLGLPTVGVVRGDEGIDNAMLACMRNHGMQLHFVSRAEYRQHHDPHYCAQLCRRLRCSHWLPEGGASKLAVSGCERILHFANDQLPQQARSSGTTLFVMAVGTGATLAGIARACGQGQRASGVQLVNDAQVPHNVRRWAGESNRSWSLHRSDKLGAYGRPSTDTLNFIVRFFTGTGIALDPVYTGPAMVAVLQPEYLNTVEHDARVVFIHTGGLAGAEGYGEQFGRCDDQRGVSAYFSKLRELTTRNADTQ